MHPKGAHSVSVLQHRSLNCQESRNGRDPKKDPPQVSFSVLPHLLCPVSLKEGTPVAPRHGGADDEAHLDEELLAGGPPLPSKLARPGPVRAPNPPARRHELRCHTLLKSPPLPDKHPTLKPRDKRGSGDHSGLGCRSSDCSDVAFQKLIL